MARGLEVSSKLPNYTKKKFFRPSQLEVSLNAKGKDENTKYQLRISNLHRSDFQEDSLDRIKWSSFKINKNWKFKTAVASKDIGFVSAGDTIALLVSADGRKIRLGQGDFTPNDLQYFAELYKGAFGIENLSVKDLVKRCKYVHKPHYCMPDTHRQKSAPLPLKKGARGAVGPD